MAWKQSDADWGEIERLYAEGIISVCQLALDFGVNEGTIRARAKKYGWVRSAARAAKEQAYTKANDRALTTFKPTPAERIEELAQTGADIITGHRHAAAGLRELLGELTHEFMEMHNHLPELEQRLVDYFTQKAEGSPLLAAMYRQQMQAALRALSHGSRAKTLLNLSSAAEKLINIERQAWRLNDDDDNRSYEDVLAEVYDRAMNKRVVATQPKSIAA